MESQPTPSQPERKVVDGNAYEKVDKGYTIREWYTHESPEIGPGPGWDTREKLLDDTIALRETGSTFTWDELQDPLNLPDTPYYRWELTED